MSYNDLKLSHQKFVDAYIETGCGSKAYRRAGYKGGNNRIISANSARLIANDSIQSAIKDRKNQLMEKSFLTLIEKKAMLAKIARFGMLEVNVNGIKKMLDPKMTIKAIQELNRMDGDIAPIKAEKTVGHFTITQTYKKPEPPLLTAQVIDDDDQQDEQDAPQLQDGLTDAR